MKDVPGLAPHRAARTEDVPQLTVEDWAGILQILGHGGVKQWKNVLTERDCHFDSSDVPADVMVRPAKPFLVASRQIRRQELFLVLIFSRPA
jgi:hypothetical protein